MVEKRGHLIQEASACFEEKNSELFLLYKEISISSYIKIQRLKWLGHVMRISTERVASKVYVNIPDGVRPW